MAVTVDLVTNKGVTAGSSSITFSHTCAAGSCLLVGVHTSNETASGVTYNAVAMSLAESATHATLPTNLSVWKLIAPASGAHNVVVTLTAGNDSGIFAISFLGADPTAPFGTAVKDVWTAQAAGHSHNTTCPIGGMVLDAITLRNAAGLSAFALNAGQTSRVTRYDITGTSVSAAASSKDGAGTTSTGYTWTNGGTNEYWVHVTVPVNPAGGSGLLALL